MQKYFIRVGLSTITFASFAIVVILLMGFTLNKSDISGADYYIPLSSQALSSAALFDFRQNDELSLDNFDPLKKAKTNSNSSEEVSFDRIFKFSPDSTDDSTNSLLSDSTDVMSRKDSLMFGLIKPDSVISDSALRIDSMKTDSTARIKYFKQNIQDLPYTQFSPKKKSSFLVYPSTQKKQRKIELDSTGSFVIISESIVGNVYRPVLKIPLNDFIKLKLKFGRQELWEKQGREYVLKSGKTELADLMSGLTNIDIPLPDNSFLSIFGPPKISIRISGAVDIHGAWRSETTAGVTASALGNTRNEPDFKQQVQINVNGTIGDKLTLKADWNTERDFDYENQLSLKYQGYDDELIQSIEAGNVSMQTTPLIGGSEALFGIKAQFKIGPLKLTTLASQKKSKVAELSVSGGSQKSEFTIRAYDYSENHYFIDSIYYDTSEQYNFFNKKFSNPTFVTTQESRYYYVKDIEVWKSTTGLANENERRANAYIDLEPKSTNEDSSFYDKYRATDIDATPGRSSIDQRFIKLTENMDYEIHPQTGFITFRTPIQAQDEIAVAYRIEGPVGTEDIYYGEFLNQASQDSSSVLVLKLVKPKNLIPDWETAWKLRLKNIYPIGGRDIKQEEFKFDLLFEVDGGDPVPELNGVKFIEAFGLDQFNSSGQASPDGEFDFDGGRTIFTTTGEIIFPTLEPFGANFPSDLDESMRYDSIYTKTKTQAKEVRDKDKYIMSGEYSAGLSSVFNIGFGMVENSVKVKLGGNELQEGKDFQVDYNIGQVTILNDQALVPGADLKITYEKNDLFSLASKTLLGLRGEYEFSDETKLGFSYMNLNQQTLSDKVRIGEEPLDNSIMGLDFKTSQNLPFITKALDKVISTSTDSKFTLQGEYAYMKPDPNTKKSTIAADQGKSIAYVDDFEGSKKLIPIGVGYTSWTDASAPNDIPGLEGLSKPILMNYKAKSFWFSRQPSDIDVKNIYGNRKQTSRDANQIMALNYVVYPEERGSYNYDPDPNFTENPEQNWGGIMKGLSSTASNLVEENIEFIEFWFKNGDGPVNQDNQYTLYHSTTKATLFLDLGTISEDVIPNNELDTEDKNSNDLIDEGEDIGIDGLTNAQEKLEWPDLGDDPSLDNFRAPVPGTENNYVSANGTEGNSISTDMGRIPDSEDLNRNKSLDRVDSYFRYEIPVDTNTFVNPYIAGGGDNGWYLIRIPLKEFKKKIGSPSFENVEFIRLWATGIPKDEKLHVRLAEFNLVGNQWKRIVDPPRVTKDDSVLSIATIGLEENPEYYSPPGVFQEVDRQNPDDKYLKNEQSLNLEVRDLADGDYREIVKYLFRPLDLFNYKEMKMFVHGDTDSLGNSVSYFNSFSDYGSEIYFRFGTDTLNYYEVRQPVRGGWKNMNIVFKDLTAIKDARDADSVALSDYYRVPVRGKPGQYYAVRGQPALTKITFLMIGVVNPEPKTDNVIDSRAVSGDIWVNELRVIDADDTPGWAYSASTSLALADLMNVKFNVSQTDPNFHKLNERFGSRIDKGKWGVSADFDLVKIIPFNISGSSIKVNYSRSESVSKPVYMPGTDITVEASAEQKKLAVIKNGGTEQEAERVRQDFISETYSLNTSQTYGISNLSIKIPTEKWYIRDIIGGFAFSYNFNETFSRNPTTESDKKWRWDASGRYSVAFSRENYITLSKVPIIGILFSIFKDYEKLRFYYTPQSFDARVTAKRNYSFTLSRGKNVKPNIQQDFQTTRGGGFNWKISDGGLLNISWNYKLDINSSLAYLLTDDNGFQRSNKEIVNDILNGAGFGDDYKLNQTFDVKLKPMLPTLFNLNRYFTLSAGYSANYSWQRDFRAEDLGRSAGVRTNFTSSLNLKLKSLFDPLFAGLEEDSKSKSKTSYSSSRSNRGRTNSNTSTTRRRRGRGTGTSNNNTNLDAAIKDNEAANRADTDTLAIPVEEVDTGTGLISESLSFLALSVKWILFDYDQIRVNYTNSTTVSGSGLKSPGTGVKNFWGTSFNEEYGPSRAFQLGLDHDIGPRAPLGQPTDNFNEKNNIDLRTSRPLWKGAKLDINWKTGWGLNKTVQFNTDEWGNIVPEGITTTSTRTIDRTFFTMAGFPISIGKVGIDKVRELYDRNAANPTNNLSEAFSEGMESFPILSKIPFLADVARYIPRPNWSLSWSGLEKLPLIKSIAKRASLNHAYASSYFEGWKVNTDGVEEIQSQKITSGFNPLIGLNLTFDKFWGGDLTGSIKYSTKVNYDLGVSTRNITESKTGDISLTASYKLRGFELGLFGINLKNDLEFSLSYSRGSAKIMVFNMDASDENFEGVAKDGNTRISIEPRIKYVMSSKVTLSVFYKRSSVTSDGASRIPETTTNEAGLDVRIAIGN